jgi:hypothetical protein
VPLILGKGTQQSRECKVSSEDEGESIQRERDERSKTVMGEESKPKLPKDSPQLDYVYVRESERERERGKGREKERVSVCVCECVRESVRVWVCQCE